MWLPIALVFLWFILVEQLRIAWTANPQYSYGWVVPVLCLGLLFRRAYPLAERIPQKTESPSPRSQSSQATIESGLVGLFIGCALLLFPLRLVLEANPNWPTPQWLLALSTVGLSLIATRWLGGPRLVRQFGFPLAFILVAVAWPPSVETPLIQSLTRANVAATIELVGWLGIPASQHGNLIEIAGGMVGVNEACSGIRSFQSSLMISLFLGEFYRLAVRKRLLLVLLGGALAFLFNLSRTSILVTVAAHKGVAAVSAYHDPAGISVLVASTLLMWALAALLGRRRAAVTSHPPPSGVALSAPAIRLDTFHSLPAALGRLGFGLLVWLLLLELGVETWYRLHELNSPKSSEWTLAWPPGEPSFREVAIPAAARELLKYDQGHGGTWMSSAGAPWQLYYLRWRPGKLAATSAWGHTPDVCLAAAGKTLRPLGDNRCPMQIGSLLLPFRRYEYEENGQVVYVFHCLWEEHAPGRYAEPEPAAGLLDIRLHSVLKGWRHRGQRSLEILVAGLPDSKAAQSAVKLELRKLIKVAAAQTPPRNPTASGPRAPQEL